MVTPALLRLALRGLERASVNGVDPHVSVVRATNPANGQVYDSGNLICKRNP
jgi:hypothetical protein